MDKEQILSIKSGMRVRVWSKVKEGNKTRTVPFEGTVLARKHGKGTSATFTVRKIGAGEVGIERVWPFHSPLIEKVDILASPKVRRAKLYYLRDLSRRKTKAKLRKTSSKPSIENVSPKETTDSAAE